MLLRFFSSLCAFLFLCFAVFQLFFSRQKKYYFTRIKNSFGAPYFHKPQIWFHGASVGEVELIKKITTHWKVDFFITTNTLGGLQQARIFQPRSYLAPLDFSFSIKIWQKKMKVCGLVLIEAEIWANLINIMAKKIPLSLINARTSSNFFNKLIYQKLLPKFTLVTASSQSVADFYQSLTSHPKIHCFGNLKFFMEKTTNNYALRKYFAKNSLIFVASSLQPEEMPIILQAIKQVQKINQEIYFVFIPRHPEKKNQFLYYLAKEDLQIINNHPPKKITKKMIFIPLLGVVRDWYASANSIFVGGSLCNRGGQNMIEALYYSIPTATGYNTKNFEFAMRLFLNQNAIVKVHNAKQLASFIQNSIQTPQKFFAKRAKKIITQQADSLPKTINLLKKTYDF